MKVVITGLGVHRVFLCGLCCLFWHGLYLCGSPPCVLYGAWFGSILITVCFLTAILFLSSIWTRAFLRCFACMRETEPAAVWSSRAQTKESLCGCCSEVLCQTRSAKLLLAFGHVLQVLRSLCHVVSCPATSFLRDILSLPLIDRPVRLRIYAQSPLLRHKRQIIIPTFSNNLLSEEAKNLK